MAKEESRPGMNTEATNQQHEGHHCQDQAPCDSSASWWQAELHGDRHSDDSHAALAKPEVPPPCGSINGAAVLEQVVAWLRRFIRVTFDHDYQLLALWIVHTYLAVECYTTPRLQLDSPVEGSGKTTVLDHFKRLAHNPIQIASLSSPALLPRLINNGMRTILLDEVHRTLRPDKPGVSDLVAVMNTGYRRGATRPVNVPMKGGGWDVVDMPTFAPVALAGNDPNLENDTRSRTIRVLLMPDLDGSVEDSDWEYLEDDAKVLQEKIALWADSVRETVKGMHVEVPTGCIGRSKEKWRPLKRIAVAAGGCWPKIADELIINGLQEEAAVREAGLKKQPPGVVLLIDLYAVWPYSAAFMPTTELVDLLVAHNPSYWGEESPYGKRLTETRLGHMINRATNSTSTRPGGKGPRGYTRSALQIAWDRLRIGHTDLADTVSANPSNPANPADPAHKSAQPASDGTGLAALSGCTESDKRSTELHKTTTSSEGSPAEYDLHQSFDALTNDLLTEFCVPEAKGRVTTGHAPQPRPDRKPEFVYGFCECGDMSGPPLVDQETGLCRSCWGCAPIKAGAS